MKKTFLLMVVILAATWMAGCDTIANSTTQKTPVPTSPSTGDEMSVSASGEVVPGNWVTLSMPASGLIEDMTAKDGDAVTAGQLLVQLTGKEEFQARIASAQFELVDAQNALDTLIKNAPTQLAMAKKALADAQKTLNDAKDERHRKNLSRVSQPTIDEKQSELIIAKEELRKAKENYTNYERRPESDIERAQAFNAVAAAQQKVDQITYDLNWLLSGPDQNEIDRADADILLAQSRLDDAQREVDLLKNGPDPALVKIANARIANAEAQLAAAKKAADGLELLAPFSGVVSEPRVHAGEYLTYGQPVMQLVDPTSLLVESTDLSETDVTRIKPGDIASVTFDALPGVSVPGKVTTIRTRVSDGPGVNFAVRIELNNLPEGLRWGMTAFIVITLQR